MLKPRRLRIIVALLVVDLLATSIWFCVIIQNEQHSLFNGPVDVGIVLMGDFEPDYKNIGPETLRRLLYALALYREGKIRNIICSGGARRKHNVYGSEVMKDALVARGVPSEVILTERESNDSLSNWKVAYAITRQHKWRSVTIITSMLHQHRIKKIVFQTEYPDVEIYFSPYYYPTGTPAIRFPELWEQIHHEWVSYFVYFVLPEKFYRKILELTRN